MTFTYDLIHKSLTGYIKCNVAEKLCKSKRVKRQVYKCRLKFRIINSASVDIEYKLSLLPSLPYLVRISSCLLFLTTLALGLHLCAHKLIRTKTLLPRQAVVRLQPLMKYIAFGGPKKG